MSTINYSQLPYSIVTSNGQVVWRLSDLPLLMDYVKENKWIILGGDVLTCSGNYTYDNWHYNPNCYLSLTQNVHQSVAVCLDYVTNYTDRNGSNFLFSLVLSDTFLSSTKMGDSFLPRQSE